MSVLNLPPLWLLQAAPDFSDLMPLHPRSEAQSVDDDHLSQSSQRRALAAVNEEAAAPNRLCVLMFPALATYSLCELLCFACRFVYITNLLWDDQLDITKPRSQDHVFRTETCILSLLAMS